MLIRVGSRLKFAPIQEEAKYPVILPKGDKNVEDIIRHVHQGERHAGVNHVLCQLRKRYWVLQGRQTVKSTLGKCVQCQRLKKKPCAQKMGVLPAPRVATASPFSATGVDVMGP